MDQVDNRSGRRVTGDLGFSVDMDVRPKFHANDTSLDVLNIVPRSVPIEDARLWSTPPSLDVQGFSLYPHKSEVRDFSDQAQVAQIHPTEIQNLLLRVSGADHVIVAGGGILRFSERSKDSGALNNSRPARLAHIDVSDTTATAFYARSKPEGARPVKRAAQYNVWRAISTPPQDVPLAVCDARSLSPEDLMPADAMFDVDGKIVMSFEALVIRYNAMQRWSYFSGMTRDEALVFKTNDTDLTRAHQVAHGAFDDPTCPQSAPPRASLEMRGIAFWYE
jgi:hypothetical protein